MLAEWGAECGADDPVLVVPWSDPGDPAVHFVDLRDNDYDLDHIREADHHPALLAALRALNAARSPVFTAKCDLWPSDPEEIELVRYNLGSDVADLHHGFAGYIDLIWRERTLFVSFHRHEQALEGLVRKAERLDLPHATLECTLRPALVDLEGPQEGFAVTLYVKALGTDAEAAYAAWSDALTAIVALVRNNVRVRGAIGTAVPAR